MYQPNSDEESFFENPFGEEELENEVCQESEIEEEVFEDEFQIEENSEIQSDENIIKYDYNLEPEEPVDCMSEEERMNATVPLMNIQLGDDDSDEEEESSYDDEKYEEKSDSNSDFVDIDFDEVPVVEEQVSVPKDPLFKTAHEETNFEEVDFEEIKEVRPHCN